MQKVSYRTKLYNGLPFSIRNPILSLFYQWLFKKRRVSSMRIIKKMSYLDAYSQTISK